MISPLKIMQAGAFYKGVLKNETTSWSLSWWGCREDCPTDLTMSVSKSHLVY
jgi:hypothetical protein